MMLSGPWGSHALTMSLSGVWRPGTEAVRAPKGGKRLECRMQNAECRMKGKGQSREA